jgi:tRNA threonylcarbamoyladenosine biosynthesis protein TsaE
MLFGCLIRKVNCRDRQTLNKGQASGVTMVAKNTILTGEWLSTSAQETFRLGERLGEQLTGGEILLLSGPLGAGKTVFVKGIASALDLDPYEVTSPSFTLVNPYEGRLRLFHIDLYRLDEGSSAAHAVDLEELLTDDEAVIVIEWAERMGAYRLPPDVWRINISGAGDEPRRVMITET